MVCRSLCIVVALVGTAAAQPSREFRYAPAEPVPVEVGLRLQQITQVAQREEHFGAVVTLRMRWKEPALAFDPAECRCDFRLLPATDLREELARKELPWPAFTLYNQQGNRWIQNQLAVVRPDGEVAYLERFTTDFQAPDFDFRRFPFDEQHFFIRVDQLFPLAYYRFVPLDDYSTVGDALGEEEWRVVAFDTEISTSVESTSYPVSRFSLHFVAERLVTYYAMRIFIPLLLIVIVGWLTFFIGDWMKRVEATSATLLLFIAYNFAVGGDLPKLGYLTLIDVIFLATFLVSVLLVAWNVALKNLHSVGREALARRLDRPMKWVYPMLYGGIWIVTAIAYLAEV